MPLYFFHVRQRDTRFEDPQGIELPDLLAAWEHAHRDARSIALTQILKGEIDEHWIEIGDETGTVVATVPFRRAMLTH